MITINTELKPCPFCGRDPRTSIGWRTCDGYGLTLEFSVRCDNCGISRGWQEEVNNEVFDTYINSMNKALELWNERV